MPYLFANGELERRVELAASPLLRCLMKWVRGPRTLRFFIRKRHNRDSLAIGRGIETLRNKSVHLLNKITHRESDGFVLVLDAGSQTTAKYGDDRHLFKVAETLFSSRLLLECRRRGVERGHGTLWLNRTGRK